MRAKYAWLLLPCAAAIILCLGPLGAPRSTPATGEQPASPSTLQVVSTCAGVLCLGVAIVLGLSRLSRRRPTATRGALALRESLRLSGRHTVHVVQFEDRVLLLGECEGQLTVLEGAAHTEVGLDEAELDHRTVEEDGATPPDLVIPRPAGATKRQPHPPKTAAATLGDFNALLTAARGRKTDATKLRTPSRRLAVEA